MMIVYFLLLQVLVTFAGRIRSNSKEELLQDDANSGVEINAYRLKQLELHNYYRSLHGVPLMKLDDKLNQQAQSFAEELVAKNIGLKHCFEVAGCNDYGAGENAAEAPNSASATNQTGQWYSEVWSYDFCSTTTAKKRPGPGMSKYVLHFTQVVWASSTQLGIGRAVTSDGKKAYIIARYKPSGNIRGAYGDQVVKPKYILSKYQDNCYGINGGYSSWSGPGECSRSCGGGIRFRTRTCTNPKPSLNGANCVGPARAVAAYEWCNIQRCPGDKSHRAMQCEALGYLPKSYQFTAYSKCLLFCQQSEGEFYMDKGNVEDGTHCDSTGTGVCVGGKCVNMPRYVTV